uniref:Uncharacterized protein n=1 Tax=Oryza punctata TaxID=4537 RepID=A0A0E0JE99_ORYPU
MNASVSTISCRAASRSPNGGGTLAVDMVGYASWGFPVAQQHLDGPKVAAAAIQGVARLLAAEVEQSAGHREVVVVVDAAVLTGNPHLRDETVARKEPGRLHVAHGEAERSGRLHELVPRARDRELVHQRRQLLFHGGEILANDADSLMASTRRQNSDFHGFSSAISLPLSLASLVGCSTICFWRLRFRGVF